MDDLGYVEDAGGDNTKPKPISSKQLNRHLLIIRNSLDELVAQSIKQTHHLQSIRTWIAVFGTLALIGMIIILLSTL